MIGLNILLFLLLLLSSACGEGLIQDPGTNWGAPVHTQTIPLSDNGPEPLRLLTRTEFANTVTDLGFLDDATPVVASFPSQNVSGGFDNMAHSHTANPELVGAYMQAAEVISAGAWQRRNTALFADLAECAATTQQSVPCAHAVLRSVLPRIFRRPVSQEQLTFFTSFFDAQMAIDPFEKALRMTLEVALQSPDFLYQAQHLNADGVPDGYTIASRLSYFLWASMPDKNLLEAAARGELHSRTAVEKHARRMLEDNRARVMVWRFNDQWLNLSRVNSVTKSPEVYPNFSKALRGPWRNSVLAFVNHFYFQNGTLNDLLSSPKIFSDGLLAQTYGWSLPEGSTGYVAIEGDPQKHVGLLSQPGLLAVLGHADRSAPIHRGVFVRNKILCQELPPPPGDAPSSVPTVDENLSTRDIVSQLTSPPECASCHVKINPVGFAFENYDGMGAWRQNEIVGDDTLAIDASGFLVQSPDPTADGAVDGLAGDNGLAVRLLQSDAVSLCLVKQWYRYMMGRGEKEQDGQAIKAIHTEFQASGKNLKELLVQLALSNAFRSSATSSEVRP